MPLRAVTAGRACACMGLTLGLPDASSAMGGRSRASGPSLSPRARAHDRRQRAAATGGTGRLHARRHSSLPAGGGPLGAAPGRLDHEPEKARHVPALSIMTPEGHPDPQLPVPPGASTWFALVRPGLPWFALCAARQQAATSEWEGVAEEPVHAGAHSCGATVSGRACTAAAHTHTHAQRGADLQRPPFARERLARRLERSPAPQPSARRPSCLTSYKFVLPASPAAFLLLIAPRDVAAWR